MPYFKDSKNMAIHSHITHGPTPHLPIFASLFRTNFVFKIFNYFKPFFLKSILQFQEFQKKHISGVTFTVSALLFFSKILLISGMVLWTHLCARSEDSQIVQIARLYPNTLSIKIKQRLHAIKSFEIFT